MESTSLFIQNAGLFVAAVSISFGALGVATPILIEASDESEAFKNASYFYCAGCVFLLFSIALTMLLVVKNA